MKDFDLSITICSWNTVDDLRACLASLTAIKGEANFEVIVVDNNSEDGSPKMVAEDFPWFRLEEMKQNLGFVGGQNYAAANRREFLLGLARIRTKIRLQQPHPHSPAAASTAARLRFAKWPI